MLKKTFNQYQRSETPYTVMLRDIDFPTAGHLTVSIGLSFVEASDEEPEDAVRRADQALYLAKEDGRNQTKMI